MDFRTLETIDTEQYNNYSFKIHRDETTKKGLLGFMKTLIVLICFYIDNLFQCSVDQLPHHTNLIVQKFKAD